MILGWAGVVLFAAILTAATGFLLWRARAEKLLWPVATGFLLRLVVMLVAHYLSVSLGERGIMFLDDQGYLQEGAKLAAAWGAGHLPDPAAYNYVGSYEFGFPVLTGAVFLLTGTSVLAVKLLDVVLGSAVVLMVGSLARRLSGPGSVPTATWMAALMPTMIWWSAPMLKECLATFLFVLVLLCATRLPRASGVAGTSLGVVALFLTRSIAAGAVVIGLVAGAAAVLVRARASIRWPKVGACVGVLVVAVGLVLLAVTGGHPNLLVNEYSSTASRMFHVYEGGDLSTLPANVLKSLVSPLPWAFGPETRDWDRGLYPGMWVLFFLYPTALRGVWRVYQRPEGIAVLVAVALVLILNSATSGFVFRQRSVIEPLILLLAVAGMTSWRQLVSWGAAGIGVAGVVAAADTRSPGVTVAILAGAGALALLARRLPGAPSVPPEAPSYRPAATA